MKTYYRMLDSAMKKNKSHLCVGLDSDYQKLPRFILNDRYPQFAFNKTIIDATHSLVCAYKPNSAFYEVRGEHGILQLQMTCKYIHEKYPGIPVILDAKRGDIGESNDRYDRFAFEYLGADAITLHPYLGHEALEPFLRHKEKGCYILCRTSNPGAGEFQDLKFDGKRLYQIVAKRVAVSWNKKKNCGLIVGATYPAELKIVRRIAPTLPLLIPGVGAQGGDLKKSVQNAGDNHGGGFIITSSRSIIFASGGSNFAQKAKEAALLLKNAINKCKS